MVNMPVALVLLKRTAIALYGERRGAIRASDATRVKENR